MSRLQSNDSGKIDLQQGILNFFLDDFMDAQLEVFPLSQYPTMKEAGNRVFVCLCFVLFCLLFFTVLYVFFYYYLITL